ncbi:MAG: periplasmic heavy metal sensor [Deltaproteobacteria bacterium]|nr:periplasmic heavy metal sensor [Deltaproteobacteria bacterium]
MIRILVFLLAVVTVTPVLAQPGLGPGAADKREKIKKKIRAMRAYTLTEELQLDETTAGKLFPTLAKYDDELDRLLQQRADIERRLKGAADIKDPRALDKLIDEAVANQKAFWDSQERRVAELRKILTPAQTARLLVVLPEFERRIQNQLQRALKGGPGPRKAGKGEVLENPYGRDDDDDDLPAPKGPRAK